MRSDEEGSQGPVIRDRRRIDPATGQVRDAARQGGPGQAGPPQRGPGQPRPGRHAVSKPGGGSGAAPGAGPSAPGRQETPGAGGGAPAPDAGLAAEVEQMTIQLAERTADLQRLQAEYANYRKRVERDRLAVREQALANVLNELVPVLDDIGRAREHGELTGGFKSVADSLEAITGKLGLTSFGEAGDPFDPMLHEALMHAYSAEVTEPTAVQILQPGYKVGERIIRPARVAVAEPGDTAEPAEAGQDDPAVAADAADEADEPGAASDDTTG